MRAMLLRRFSAALIGLAVATGVLTLAPVPANAASFGVSIAVSDVSVRQGDKVTISGKVSPRPSSRSVYLQQRDVGSTSWRTVKKFKTAKSGSYKVTVTAGDTKDRYYRIYKPKQGKRKAAHSAIRHVIVDPVLGPGAPATLAGLSPTRGPLAGGQQVTITGSGLAGTTRVTFTPLVPASYTKDNTGILPELEATVRSASASSIEITTPASLGGRNLVTVYARGTTLTATYTYVTTPREATTFEAQVLTEINARRAKKQTCGGTSMPAVGHLRWDGGLGDVALAHARDLAARQQVYRGIQHETYQLDSFAQRFYAAGFTAPFGEILQASSVRSTATTVVQAWMKSPGHCASIMRSSWSRVGVGVAPDVRQSQPAPQGLLFSNVDFR